MVKGTDSATSWLRDIRRGSLPLCTLLSSFLTDSQQDGVNRYNAHKDLLVSVSHHTAINSVATDSINHLRFLPLEVTPCWSLPLILFTSWGLQGPSAWWCCFCSLSSVKTLKFLRAEPLNTVSFMTPPPPQHTHSSTEQLTDIC